MPIIRHPTSRIIALAAFLCAFASAFPSSAQEIPPLPAARRDDKPSASRKSKASELLEKALAETNIESPDSPAFLLEADAQFTDGKQPVRGKFGLSWAASNLYRQQIIFPGFSQTVVISSDTLSRTRNTDFLPLPAFEWEQMIELPHSWSVPDNVKFDSRPVPPAFARAGNVHITCLAGVIELKRNSIREEFCIDTDDTVPLGIEVRYPEGRSIKYTFVYGAPLGGKRFPQTITYDDSIGLHAVITVRELKAVSAFAATEFHPVDKATAEEWCADPAFKSSRPDLDDYLHEFNKWSGNVTESVAVGYFYVRVDTKGKVQKAELLYPLENPELKDAASNMYSRIAPTKLCSGRAIAYETVWQVDFLSPID